MELNYLDEFLDFLKFQKSASLNTLDAYSRDIGQFLDFLESEEGNLQLKDVNTLTLRNFLSYLHQTKNKRTISRKIASLRSFYKFLCFKGYVKTNPVLLITSPKLDKNLPEF